MLFRGMILILLYWPCVMSEEAGKTEDMIDQIATASKQISASLIIPKTPEKPNASRISSISDETTTVYYQNSNGFVPMINHDSSQSSQPKDSTPVPPDYPNKWTNDAVFSTEARLLLALPNSRSNRRSFSLQEAQKDFEILKVNNKTPAIANYHDFYENMQNNLGTNSRDPRINRLINSTSIRTRDRIKMIDEYFNKNLDHRKSNYHHHLHNYQEDVLHKPSIFEPEKVHNNYPQYGVSNNHAFNYMTPLPQKMSNPGVVHFDSYNQDFDRKKSKPVVIPEPNDWRNDMSTQSPHVSSESEDRYDRKEDYSDNSDYLEITERPRRVNKSRRRPSDSDTSRKQPLDHRDRDAEDTKKINSGRAKSRGRGKNNYWNDEREQSSENLPAEHKNYPESSSTADNQQNLVNEPNVWNQVSPNVELSHSNGYEINQLDNTKLLFPVNLNLVPISNFNHAPNAGISSMITATPLVSSTASPLLSTSSSMIIPKLPQNSMKNYGYPTGIPDVIVGQNAFQSPVQAVLLPQINVQSKFPQNGKTQYLASTVAPMLTISQQFTPTAHGIQSTQSPKLTSPGNQYGPQMFLPQSTVHTFLQTPMNTGNYNIFVNSRDQANHPQANTNSLKYESQSPDKHNQYHLTSASLSVSQDGNTRDKSNNNNNEHNNGYRESSSNSPRLENQDNSYQVIRGAQVVPAIVHANGVSGVDLMNQNHGHIHQAQSISQPTYVNQNSWRQLQQFQVHDPNKNTRYQNVYGIDSLGSTSNNNANTVNNIRNSYMEQAQLPVVGMQTVEIRNPNINIKPSPVDLTMVNPLEAVHYPAAVLTTPIPILTTTGFLTPRPIMRSTPEPISIQSYVDSLTQIGSQNNQDLRGSGNQQSGIFNPMNFVPNWDLIKSQTMLNSKVHIPKPLPQQLNLVPEVPGGNFDKHSSTAQVDLITKPKLSADLEKYAEEMFKESLRTIYNTHKWNSDKRVRNLTDSDIAELERLKSDLSRFKAAMTGSYGKDIEAHYSENKFRAIEPGNKHSGLSAAAIEQLFKSDFKVNGQSDNFYSSQDGKSNRPRGEIRINDYLTPPKMSSHNSGKKRPGKGSRYEGKSRPHSKPHSNTRPSSPDAASSNHIAYSHRRPSHDRSTPQKGYKKILNYDEYPTFTTSSPNNDINVFNDNGNSFRRDYYDINHPRMHNLFGLLMKNKQLPSRSNSNYFYDDQDTKRDEFFYDEVGTFRKKSDSLIDSSHIL